MNGEPREAVDGIAHGAESIWSSITGEGSSRNDGACGNIPTGAKPPRAAYPGLEDETGLARGELSDALHKLKRAAGIPPDANTRVDPEGNVYDEETGENIGNIVDEGHG